MDKKNVINFSNTSVQKPSQGFTQTRAKSYKIKASPHNFAQYIQTIKAYAIAALPFNHIANAGEFLGDEVERLEIDAAIQDNWHNKVGEIVEDENQILAWQGRGEMVSVTNQLSSPATTKGQEIVISSTDLTTGKRVQEKTLEVVEGINVQRQEVPSLPSSTSNSGQALEDNPYLKAPPLEIGKAN